MSSEHYSRKEVRVWIRTKSVERYVMSTHFYTLFKPDSVGAM